MGERRHRHLPSIADAPDQILLRDFRVGEEHLVKRRVAVHLLERLHVDTGLLHVDHEIRQPLVLGRVPIGAGEQQAVVGMMRTGRPHLLSVDDPEISLQIRACGGAGEIGTAARLAEELAPGIFAGENTAQELLFLQIRSVLEQRGRGQQSHSGFGGADGAHVGEFLFHHSRQRVRKPAAVPFLRPLRHAPSGIGELAAPLHQRHIRIPVGREPLAHFGTHLGFADFAHRSNSPTLHQEFPVITRLTEEHLGAFGALEP